MFGVELIVVSAIMGIPASYIARLLWLDTVEMGFEGFFVHQRKFLYIREGEELHIQRVAWTDYIRQLLFNVYEVGKEWELKPNRQGLVRCTFCLSFWVSIPFALIVMLHYGVPFYLYPLVHFSVSAVSALLSDRM